MKNENCCCFTGHRVLGMDFNRALLVRGIEYLIKKGVDTFICGGALGFDTVCAEAVLELKEVHPHIRLHIYAPCNNQCEKWQIDQRVRYERILEKADYVDMPNRAYFTDCMKIRNQKMVDNAAYCICYLNSMRSGTGQTYSYARKKGLTVYNIAGR